MTTERSWIYDVVATRVAEAMSKGDQIIKFQFGKYAGCAIGFQWRRMDEGRVLWWYPASKKPGKLCEPTRNIPADVLEVVNQYTKLGEFAGMTVCEFVVSTFNEHGQYD